jgi:isopenicillin N synthase-like dioxygenase
MITKREDLLHSIHAHQQNLKAATGLLPFNDIHYRPTLRLREMSKTGPHETTIDFDPIAKEQQLRSESGTWDTSQIFDAQPGDIPVIDLHDYFTEPDEIKLKQLGEKFRIACETVGFFSIIGHQIPRSQLDSMFEFTSKFHELALADKNAIAMDQPHWPVGGIGYLPVRHRKLPTRDRGNLNEAFIVKCDHNLTMNDNQWPAEAKLPGFRNSVESYAHSLELLGKQLLPIFATALSMQPSFFDQAFTSPLYRLRLTHYPPQASIAVDEFGIAPHVDTTFCTILAQDQPGLVIYSERRKQWIKAPLLEDAFIVNSGELLRTWTNDRFISVKHFANNTASDQSRYSIPFFLNANSNYSMTCIPSCCGPDNPPKYPPISYAESQAKIQGE